MAYYVYDLESGDVVGGYDTAAQARPHIITGRSMTYEVGPVRDWTYFDVVDGVLVTDPERLAIDVRAERDLRLVETDWTQLMDITDDHVPGTRENWRIYRQQLRDIPQQATFPGHVDWPVVPTEPEEPEEPADTPEE